MKGSLIYLGLATLAIATPVPQHEHKTPEKPAFLQGGAPATPLGLFKITSKGSPVSKKSGVVRDQLYYGPLSLKTVAQRKAETGIVVGMDPQGNVFNHKLSNFPGDVTLLSSRTSVRNAEGVPQGISQGVYNHHISIPDTNVKMEPILRCPNEKAVADFSLNSFAGVGEDGGSKSFDTADSSDIKGFYIANNDNILLSAEIINNSNTTKDVYIVIDIEYVKGKPARPTSWHVLNVGMCDGKGIEIKPEDKGLKKFVITSQPMTVKRDGSIFGIRGHLHDGGVSVILKNNDKVVCESKATYGGENGKAGDWETISAMGSCAEQSGIPVKKGDTLKLETSYDFELHPARKNGNGMAAEAMGMALFSFAGV